MSQVTKTIVLGTAVANNATVTVVYPTGLVQADFTGANASGSATLVLDGQNVYQETADSFDVSYGASLITVTNKTGASWPAGTELLFGFARAGDVGEFVTVGPIASLTDNTGGTAADTLAAGVGIQTVAFHMNLPDLANGDIITEYVPGYAFKVLDVQFVVEKAVTTAAKLATLNFEIGSTNLTGGAVALTSAACTPKGAKVAGTAISAANVGTSTDTLSLEAASVTTFVEGTGWLLVRLQNLDTVHAFASLAAKQNAALAGLRSSGILNAS